MSGAVDYSKSIYRRNSPSRESLARWMRTDFAKDTLRFLTCGSVDDGKSTLIGRILYECQKILDDQMLGLEKDSQRFGTTGDEIDLALLTDGLEDERQQGITIDVGYRYFSTAKRAFIVADTPGHEQYTRNVATGASNCELAVLLVDARKGLLRQTKRHATICSLLGIRHVVLAVNKIDTVGYDQQLFERIVAAFVAFSEPLGFRSIVGIPISARYGDNVIGLSERTPWYKGESLLSVLETVDVRADWISRPTRLPVQLVCRPNSEFRGYAGTLPSGTFNVGDPIIVAASGASSTIARIVGPSGDVPQACAGDAVTVTLAEELDISRGDVICPARAAAPIADQFRAHLVWLASEPMFPGRQYVMRVGMRHVLASVTGIRHKLDVETLAREPASGLDLNEIAECNIALASPVEFEAYQENPAMGGFILIDRATNATVGMGMIKYALRRSSNIRPQRLSIDKQARAAIKFQKPAVLWFTGLSGSGKSTIADIVERRLHDKGFHTYQLDGDNVRHGLNRDLGFTEADRVENIRRIGEVARLMTEAGLIVLCSFISPFRADRQMVREKLSSGEFLEIFVDTPLEQCIARDPKGLYAKALRGEIRNFTGVDSPYEPPQAPDIHLETMKQDAEQLADVVLAALEQHGIASVKGPS